MINDHKFYMQAALEKAKEGIEKGQTPFGASIVIDNEIISCAHNQVWETIDITAHAEIQAIRQACSKLNRISLENASIYTSCEPCPMCFSAIHWAKIPLIVSGATIEDAQHYGFNELVISNEALKKQGLLTVELKQKCMENEAIQLFELWKQKGASKTY